MNGDDNDDSNNNSNNNKSAYVKSTKHFRGIITLHVAQIVNREQLQHYIP